MHNTGLTAGFLFSSYYLCQGAIKFHIDLWVRNNDWGHACTAHRIMLSFANFFPFLFDWVVWDS